MPLPANARRFRNIAFCRAAKSGISHYTLQTKKLFLIVLAPNATITINNTFRHIVEIFARIRIHPCVSLQRANLVPINSAIICQQHSIISIFYKIKLAKAMRNLKS